LVTVLIGCGTSSAKKIEPPDNSSIQPAKSSVERGPVKLTAEIEPAKARLSDNPILAVTIEFEHGVEIEKPEFGEAIGDFKILDINEPLPQTREGREIVRQIITLEPTEAGKFTIDPVGMTFRDKRPGSDGKPQSLTTRPLAVEIVSAYTKETPSLGDIRAAAGPLALPWRIPLWFWAILIAANVLAAIGIFIWRRQRKEKAALALVLSPEELARLELQKLAESGWMETDVKSYYVELTAIVRRYIERTTGIRAPEQTTEEFLREVSRCSSPLPKGEGMNNFRLKDFLESADLVKFAAHRPRREDILESFRRAEIFIGTMTDEPNSELKEALA
jgi:hypothetical protein